MLRSSLKMGRTLRPTNMVTPRVTSMISSRGMASSAGKTGVKTVWTFGMIGVTVMGMGVYYVRDQHDSVLSSQSYGMSRQLLLSDNVLRPIIAPKGTLSDEEFVAMTGYFMRGSANDLRGIADYTYTIKTTADAAAPVLHTPVPIIPAVATVAVTTPAPVPDAAPTTPAAPMVVAVTNPMSAETAATAATAAIAAVNAPTTTTTSLISSSPSVVAMPASATLVVGAPTQAIIPAGTSLDVHVQAVRDLDNQWKLVSLNVNCKETDQKFVYDRLPSAACSVITLPQSDYTFWESISTTGRVITGLAVVGGLVLMSLGYRSWRQQAPVRLTQVMAVSHPRTNELLGSPIQVDRRSWKGTLTDDTCRGSFALQGTKRKGRLTTQVKRTGDDWHIRYATVELEGSNRAIPIDVAADAKPPKK